MKKCKKCNKNKRRKDSVYCNNCLDKYQKSWQPFNNKIKEGLTKPKSIKLK